MSFFTIQLWPLCTYYVWHLSAHSVWFLCFRYQLGPNGAIVTSLNLFATRADQLITCLEKQRGRSQFVLIDTPGQIEVFTWSASGMFTSVHIAFVLVILMLFKPVLCFIFVGSILTEVLASSFPTVVAYVMDTSRNTSPVTFMSNMLYACSILYKAKLPFIAVMNKVLLISFPFFTLVHSFTLSIYSLSLTFIFVNY